MCAERAKAPYISTHIALPASRARRQRDAPAANIATHKVNLAHTQLFYATFSASMLSRARIRAASSRAKGWPRKRYRRLELANIQALGFNTHYCLFPLSILELGGFLTRIRT